MRDRSTVRVGVAGLLALAATYGLGRQAYGLFVPWFRAEFGIGLDAIGYVAGAAQLGYLLATIATGAIEARFGPRLPVVAGCVLLAVGAGLVATADTTAAFALGVILAGTSAGGAWAPFSDAVAERVPAGRRRRALALVNAGSPFGLLIASLLVAATGSSWRLAWAAFALVGLVAAVANALVLPSGAPERVKRAGYGWAGLVAPAALRLFAVAALASMTAGAYFAYAPEAAQAAGLPDWIGAAMWAALGLGGVAVGVFGGEIADRFALGRPLAVTGSSWRLAWAAFALVGLVAAVANALVLPSGAPERVKRAGYGWAGLMAPAALRLFAVAALASMTAGAYFAYAPEAAQAAGLPDRIGAAMWGVLGLSGVAVGVFGGEIADRFALGRPLAATWLGLAAALTSLLAFAGTPAGALGSAAAFGVVFTTGYAFVAMWSQEVFPDRPTTGFTATIVCIAAGFVVGPVLYGVVATSAGRPLATVVAAAPAVLAAVLSVVPPVRRADGV